jgi:hypothetical protein
LENFNGKFFNPRPPKIEQTIEESAKTIANKISIDISKAIETKLNELNQTARETRLAIVSGQGTLNSTLSRTMQEIRARLEEIGGNISGRRN